MTEFFLTFGVLGNINQRSSLTSYGSMIRPSDPRPIVHVLKIHENFNIESDQDVYSLIQLDDEKSSLNVLVFTYTCFDFKREFQIRNNDQRRCIVPGSILTLNEYSFGTLEEILKNCEDVTKKYGLEKETLILTEFSLIGYQQSKTSITDINILEDVSNKIEDSIEIKITHIISELNPRIIKPNMNFTIKAKLSAISKAREFENRLNGQKGKVLRLQFHDESAFVEIVAFNQMCESEMITSLRQEYFYLISNCEIKLSKATQRAWPNTQFNIGYDLILNQNSKIELAPLPKEINQIEQKTNQEEPIQNTTTNTKYPHLHTKFTLLSELLFKKAESYVDIVCIIDQIENRNQITLKGKQLSLRKITVVDKSNVPISVAFWGKQAEDFDYQKSTLIVFNEIKVTNYGGLSLSVMRQTKIIPITNKETISNNGLFNDLNEWYINQNTNSIKRKQMRDDENGEKYKHLKTF